MSMTTTVEYNIHKFPFTAAYCDTDAGGIVYHGRYIEIAERARMDWLRGVTFPDGDIGFIIRDLSVQYKCPLHVRDELVVESAVAELRSAAVLMEQKFMHGDTVCAIMKSTAVYVGNNMRPKRIPAVVIERILNPMASATSKQR